MGDINTNPLLQHFYTDNAPELRASTQDRDALQPIYERLKQYRALAEELTKGPGSAEGTVALRTLLDSRAAYLRSVTWRWMP